jgi:Arc/MetJ-type ribon-helix-helix transcriptional regulator
MANSKFRAAVKKAKSLYKTGRYKKFSDAVKAAYKKSPAKKRRRVGAVKRKRVKRTVTRIRTRRRISSRRISGVSGKKKVEKSLANALLAHWKTQSIKRTKQLDKTISNLKKRLKAF